MKSTIQHVIHQLNNDASHLAEKQATIGFDGFVDSIARVIKNVDEKNSNTYFTDMPEFGSYIIDKAGKSCSLEIDEQTIKLGGNMPILANALGSFGIKVNCIGAMGYPKIHEVFSLMSPNCRLFSVAQPGYCTALEFNDGKVMLATYNAINSMTWKDIKDRVGLGRIIEFFSKSSTLGMFNWSELNCSTSIWEGIIRDVLSCHVPNKNQVMYFDLSDCSKRDKVDILNALKFIEKFNEHFSVTLSLNENEATCIYKALENEIYESDLEYMGKRAYDRLNVDRLVIHPIKYSLAWEENKNYRIDNLYIPEPKLSTGAGDNFNAGLFLASLLELDIASSMIVANAASSFYVKHGYSATRNELIDFLSHWQKKIE